MRRPADGPDRELSQAFEKFETVDRELERLVYAETSASEDLLASLHRQWNEIVSLAAGLHAATAEGRRLKARMLLSVLAVVVGPEWQKEAAPHELLAGSLALDLAGARAHGSTPRRNPSAPNG